MTLEPPANLSGRIFYDDPHPAEGALHEMVVSVFPPEDDQNTGGPAEHPAGEFVLRWHDLPRGPAHGHPHLEIYGESWPLLVAHPEILAALASTPTDTSGQPRSENDPSPRQVAAALESVGFRRVRT